jgi:hypothetical protein
MSLPRHSFLNRWRAASALALAGVAALLWGCGGVGSGGTGDYVESSVNGFGSVIVGGVEFDDGVADVVDDDGIVVARNGNEVRLGMTLEVEGAGTVAPGARSAAQTLHIVTTVLGPVDTVDAGAGRLTVLGQQVQVRASTVFAMPLRGGLSTLRVGDEVAVYAYADPSSAGTLATRIEPAPGARAYRLRGVVSGLDKAAGTFRIGGALLSYLSAANVPAAMANGQRVNLRLSARSPDLTVDAFLPATRRPADAGSALVEGLVTSLSNAGTFSVNGTPIDARQASIAPAPAALAPGSFVSVQGRIAEGVLLASRVTVLTSNAIDARGFRVSGAVSGLDAVARTFTVRNVEVDYSGASFVDGTASELVNAAAVRVEGPLSTDGSRIRATQVLLR